jgi:hypothetical protein
MSMMLSADPSLGQDNASDVATVEDGRRRRRQGDGGTKASKRNNLDAEFDLGTATIAEITSAMNASISPRSSW